MLDDIDFDKYLRITTRDDKPYLDIDLILADPNPRQMLMNYLHMDTNDVNYEIFLGLPNTGPTLALAMAQYAGRRYVRARKGKRLNENEYLRILYRESESEVQNPLERKGRRHLQMRREALKKNINSQDGTLLKTALLIDGLLEDGDKALETARKLKEIGIKSSFFCVVELKDWDGKQRRGRELLEQEGIRVGSIRAYENGKYENGSITKTQNRQPIIDEKRGIILPGGERPKVRFEDADYDIH